MGKSYRIRTKPGQDQNIVVQVDQDFEQLEILSLKIRQDEVYLRMCSDYGVIAGRVFANNGYGIPNAKVTIFIPIQPEDQDNPIISTLYPYKSIEDTNEDGYKFNLLPYIPTYSNHVPTGTFPTRKDALTNQTVVELYDKYYKYSVTTNDSGDYMIFGVPVGTQTLVMNVDLSDIGPFSLTPQDLIRMGVATEAQVEGTKFKSSTNFNELPQIIVINKTIEVSPFWGQEDVCQIGITRTDFDLTNEANIDIQPTAIFMGSLVSSNEKTAIRAKDGIAQKATGELCKLVTGPGEIIGITQTIFRDSNGLPVLERAVLPNGGKLIDGAGTWLFDVPMNMDYVYTNEFGEQVISDDPTVGVPTKGKYRFKIKWQQSKSISEDYKRGYFLVPNIREKGWSGPSGDPLLSPGTPNYDAAQRSYAFSLDWTAYTTNTPINISNPDIKDAVDCEDTFYEFDYNKVYTVSGLLDNNKRISSNGMHERFLGIKRIDDDTCADDVNRFPVNDGVFHTTLIWRIFNILIIILGVICTVLLVVYHIVAYLWNNFAVPMALLIIAYSIWEVVTGAIALANSFTPSPNIGALLLSIFKILFWATIAILFIANFKTITERKFAPLKLPMLTFPDCDVCGSEGGDGPAANNDESISATQNTGLFYQFNNVNTYAAIYNQFDSIFYDAPGYCCSDWEIGEAQSIATLIAGYTGCTDNGLPQTISYGNKTYYSNDLPFGERINLFNTKDKYYGTSNNANQIKVTYNPTVNTTIYHLDNVIVMFTTDAALTEFSAGTFFTFINPENSPDPNIKSGVTNPTGTKNTTGTTVYPGAVKVDWANPSNRLLNNSTTYVLPPLTGDTNLYTYPSDIEYYQVLSAITVSEFRTISNGNTFPNSLIELINSTFRVYRYESITPGCCPINYVTTSRYVPIINLLSNPCVVVIQRGVDPYSPSIDTKIGLGKLFGKANHDDVVINTKTKLNIPILNTDVTIGGGINRESAFIHNQSNDNFTPNNGFNLYFPSYFYTPSFTDYVSYVTTKHNYYSQMDNNLAFVSPPYRILSTTPSTQFSLYVSPVNSINNTKNIFTTTNNLFYTTALSPAKYGATESLVGGSYMFKNTTTWPSISYGGYNFSKIYNMSNTMTMSNPGRIVMRADRLPSSDKLFSCGNNTSLLQQNTGMTVYILAGGGQTNVTGSFASPAYGGGTTIQGDSAYDQVLDSFTCEGMVELGCYQNEGLQLSINQSCKDNDIVEYGSYVFVKEPLKGLSSDIEKFGEYVFRFRFFYALCQGVLSNVFNNNWINGVLFAYPFKINTYYNSLNQVSRRQFPTNVLVLHDDTNNFYYRSTPYNRNNNTFLGSPAAGRAGANTRNLKYPTTILNLGPRDSFTRELVLNNNFEGYNMTNMLSTTYNDLTTVTNFFAISRITSATFWGAMFSDKITQLFSRPGKKVDADFAQSSAVNSQLGVITFDDTYYGTAPNPGATYAEAIVIGAGGLGSDTLMGIFYQTTKETNQVRDFVSPGRINRFNTATNSYVYDYYQVKSQIVPNYKWNLNQSYTIFGNQNNEWATGLNDIEAVRYQSLDRISSNYPKAGSLTNQDDIKGYIYAVDSIGNPSPLAGTNTIQPNPALGGAPWYFYFGLKKGNTAMNKFYTKYIGEGGLNE